jgi:hypothetical protein
MPMNNGSRNIKETPACFGLTSLATAGQVPAVINVSGNTGNFFLVGYLARRALETNDIPH